MTTSGHSFASAAATKRPDANRSTRTNKEACERADVRARSLTHSRKHSTWSAVRSRVSLPPCARNAASRASGAMTRTAYANSCLIQCDSSRISCASHVFESRTPRASASYSRSHGTATAATANACDASPFPDSSLPTTTSTLCGGSPPSGIARSDGNASRYRASNSVAAATLSASTTTNPSAQRTRVPASSTHSHSAIASGGMTA